MASRSALLLLANVLFFTMISSGYATTPATCPIDALQLGVCANVLGLVNVVVGSPPVRPCCSLLSGLVDLEAAACLCTAIKANVLGIKLTVPLTLSLILNGACGRQTTGYTCPLL